MDLSTSWAPGGRRSCGFRWQSPTQAARATIFRKSVNISGFLLCDGICGLDLPIWFSIGFDVPDALVGSKIDLWMVPSFGQTGPGTHQVHCYIQSDATSSGTASEGFVSGRPTVAAAHEE
jgi:hypothetical protein